MSVCSLHFYGRHNCPTQDSCLFMTKAIKSRCAQLYWERNSPKAHMRYVNWLCNHLVNINDECSYEEDTVSRNKEIMGQMWRGSFFFLCGVFCHSLFILFVLRCLHFYTRLVFRLCFMVIGNRIFGHLLVPKPFFKTSSVMLTNIHLLRKKKLTGSFKTYYFHFNTHSICYFREYNYFSNAPKIERGYDIENDITKRHYLKYVFIVFFKENVTFTTFFLLGCDTNVLW